ncbi:hypothetical protein V2J09_021379 [Rumex salicifolius]
MRRCMGGMKVTATMVMVQTVCAGINIFYKLATNDGMDLRILLAYRFLFATAFLAPFAFVVERKSRPKLTWTIIGQAFLCGLLGGSLSQNLLLEGLVLTSVTFASAMSNLIPAITYVLAVCFGMEKLGVRTRSGKAKLMGTVVGIGGAMVLTLYKGLEISLWSTNIHLLSRHSATTLTHQPSATNQIFGSLLCLSSSIAFAGWFILQAKMSINYPCFYSSTALMSFMALIQSLMFALFVNRNWHDWKLGWNIKLLSVSYIGIASGMIISLNTWCVRLRGPLFVSAFGPLMLIIVTVASSVILDEKLHLGGVIGGVVIVIGLYMVLWGKMKEMKTLNQLAPAASSPEIAQELKTFSVNIEGDDR